MPVRIGEEPTKEQQNLSTAWGRVGTALSGAMEERKYEDYEKFMERFETLCEQVSALQIANLNARSLGINLGGNQ